MPHPLTVEVESSLSEIALQKGTLDLEVVGARGEILASNTTQIPRRGTSITFNRSSWPIGETQVLAAFRADDGRTIAQATKTYLNLPRRETVGKVLNNLVTELVNVGGNALNAGPSIRFVNPRNGWIYFAATGSGSIALGIDADIEVNLLAQDEHDPDTKEAMRFLPAGEHVVTVPTGLQQFIVRAIPELAYWRYPTRADFNPMVENEIAKDLNCIGFAGFAQEHPDYQDVIDRWRQEGKRLVAAGGLVPAYHIQPLTVQKAYQFWRSVGGYSNPKFDAIIVDEFGVSDFPVSDYMLMTKALRRLTADVPDKIFYPFTMDIYGVEEVKPFMEAIIDNGALIVWEW